MTKISYSQQKTYYRHPLPGNRYSYRILDSTNQYYYYCHYNCCHNKYYFSSCVLTAAIRLEMPMLMSDISIIMRKMRVCADRHMSKHGIGFPEQQVLMLLKAHGPSNQEALANDLQIDKGSITRTVAKLEGKGLVVREVNPQNKREKLVSLQPAAEDILHEMWSLYQELETLMYNGLSQKEISQTTKCLEHMAANLSEALKEQFYD